MPFPIGYVNSAQTEDAKQFVDEFSFGRLLQIRFLKPASEMSAFTDKKAQLTLSNPRDAKACKNWSHSSLKQVTV